MFDFLRARSLPQPDYSPALREMTQTLVQVAVEQGHLCHALSQLAAEIAERDEARAGDLARLTDHVTRTEGVLCRLDLLPREA